LALAAATALAPTLARSQESEPAVVWDLTELYPTPEAWAAEKDAILGALPGLSAHKGRLGESPQALRAAMQAVSDLARRLGRMYTYASLKADEDLQVAADQERRQQASAAYAQFGAAVAWMEPELLTVGEAKIKGFLAAEPGLADFRFQLTDLFRRAQHILSPEGEKVLALAADPISGVNDIRNQLVLSDIPWPEITLKEGGKIRLANQAYTTARRSPDRAERKQVFDLVVGTYKAYAGTLGANLATQVRADIFEARSRNYASALEAALAPNNIPTAVYRTLVDEANRGLPVLHRYFEIRRRLLGLPDMHYYDIYPPTTKLDRKFTLA